MIFTAVCQRYRGLYTKLHYHLQVPASHCAEVYLQELCVPVTTTASRRHFRSAARGDLSAGNKNCQSFGPRSFAASAPWNSLPPTLRDSTLTQFGSHLFCLAYGRASRLLRL